MKMSMEKQNIKNLFALDLQLHKCKIKDSFIYKII